MAVRKYSYRLVPTGNLLLQLLSQGFEAPTSRTQEKITRRRAHAVPIHLGPVSRKNFDGLTETKNSFAHTLPSPPFPFSRKKFFFGPSAARTSFPPPPHSPPNTKRSAFNRRLYTQRSTRAVRCIRKSFSDVTILSWNECVRFVWSV